MVSLLHYFLYFIIIICFMYSFMLFFFVFVSSSHHLEIIIITFCHFQNHFKIQFLFLFSNFIKFSVSFIIRTSNFFLIFKIFLINFPVCCTLFTHSLDVYNKLLFSLLLVLFVLTCIRILLFPIQRSYLLCMVDEYEEFMY